MKEQTIRELIYKDEAYKAIDNCIHDEQDRILPADAKMNIRYLISESVLDRPQKVIAQITFDEEKLREIVNEAVERLKEEYEIADRPQGEWIEVDDYFIRCKCSICGWESHKYEDDVYGMPYCPNCGARMEGVNDGSR